MINILIDYMSKPLTKIQTESEDRVLLRGDRPVEWPGLQGAFALNVLEGHTARIHFTVIRTFYLWKSEIPPVIWSSDRHSRSKKVTSGWKKIMTSLLKEIKEFLNASPISLIFWKKVIQPKNPRKFQIE